jgi:hypothetical protein
MNTVAECRKTENKSRILVILTDNSLVSCYLIRQIYPLSYQSAYVTCPAITGISKNPDEF